MLSPKSDYTSCLIGHSKVTSPRAEGRGYPKLVTQGDVGGRGIHANSEITTKKFFLSFYFSLVFSVAAELWLAVRWWCRFKHWPEFLFVG